MLVRKTVTLTTFEREELAAWRTAERLEMQSVAVGVLVGGFFCGEGRGRRTHFGNAGVSES